MDSWATLLAIVQLNIVHGTHSTIIEHFDRVLYNHWPVWNSTLQPINRGTQSVKQLDSLAQRCQTTERTDCPIKCVLLANFAVFSEPNLYIKRQTVRLH